MTEYVKLFYRGVGRPNTVWHLATADGAYILCDKSIALGFTGRMAAVCVRSKPPRGFCKACANSYIPKWVETVRMYDNTAHNREP